MRKLIRPMLWLAGALAVPLFPLVLFGLSFEDRVEGWLQVELTPASRFAIIVGLLAVDIALPVPSSAVSTYGGGVLGMWPATLASWLGMSIGSALGFGLARMFGRAFASRRASETDLAQMKRLVDRFGPLALVITRALPILAEACVLLVGSSGLSWRRFALPVVLSNLAVSATYAGFGAFFRGYDALPAAVVASGTIPLIAALAARRWLPAMIGPPDSASSPSDEIPAIDRRPE